MGKVFWIRRFLTVLAGAFAIIAGAQALKGHPWSYCLSEGAFWGVVTATVFIATRLYWSRKGRACALCNDIPAGKPTDRDPV